MVLRLRRVLGIAGVALVLLAAWLLLPRPVAGAAPELPAARVCVVDASASVVRRRPDWLPWIRAMLRAEAERARAAGDEVCVVVFAAEVAVRFGPGDPGGLLARLEAQGGRPFDPTAERDGASALAGALEVAAGIAGAPDRRPGTVLLFGDGGYTGEDPAPRVAALRRAGARFERVEPPVPRFGDAELASLAMAPRVEVGAALVVTAEVRLTPPLPAEVALAGTLESGGELRPFVVPVPLGGAAEGRVLVPLDLGPAGFGRSVLEARVVSTGGIDPIPENDRLSASTVAEGELVLGAVATETSAVPLKSWLARGGADLFAGLQLVFVDADGLPDVLDDLDALVTYDLPIDRLSAPLVESFVQRGGGWLALSGWGFLGDWSPGGTETGLYALLPMRPAPTEQGPRDVVLLVDGSGSMAGEPFDLVRTAAVEMVAAALPSDEITLRFFTEVLEEPRLIRSRVDPGQDRRESRADATKRLLRARVPGGSTWILSSLGQLAAERERIDREALVLMLSDGRERGSTPNQAGESAALVERFLAAKTRLRVIAVGDDADLDFLGRLVAPGEEVVRAGDLTDLERIFQREVNRARVDDDAPIEVRRAPAVAGSIAAGLRAPPGAPALPPLNRLARNAAREGAEVLWESAEGDPVLGVQRVGLGRTALFSSVPREDWADAWIGEAERFGPLLRWLGRGRDRGGPAARCVGDSLVVEGLGPAWPPVVAAEIFDPLDPRKTGQEVPLTPPSAGRGGDPLDRRRGKMPPVLLAEAAGRTLALRLQVPQGADVAPGPLTVPLVVPVPAEFRGGSGRLGAAWTGADADGARETPGGVRGEPHPAGALALALGLVSLFGAGLVRRLGR